MPRLHDANAGGGAQGSERLRHLGKRKRQLAPMLFDFSERIETKDADATHAERTGKVAVGLEFFHIMSIENEKHLCLDSGGDKVPNALNRPIEAAVSSRQCVVCRRVRAPQVDEDYADVDCRESPSESWIDQRGMGPHHNEHARCILGQQINEASFKEWLAALDIEPNNAAPGQVVEDAAPLID